MRHFNVFLFVLVVLATLFSHITVFADDADDSIYEQETYNFSDYSDSNDTDYSTSSGFGDYDKRSFTKGTYNKRQPTHAQTAQPIKWEDETQVAEYSAQEVRTRHQADTSTENNDEFSNQSLSVKLKKSK